MEKFWIEKKNWEKIFFSEIFSDFENSKNIFDENFQNPRMIFCVEKMKKMKKYFSYFFLQNMKKYIFCFIFFSLGVLPTFGVPEPRRTAMVIKWNPVGVVWKNSILMFFMIFHEFPWFWLGAPIGISPSFGHFGREIFVTGSQKGSKTHYKLDSRPRVAGSIKYTYNSINK